MRTYKEEISNGEEIAKDLINLVGDVEEIDGCLQDNYFFSDTKDIKIGNHKPRKFIMILENYLNTWSSDHVLIMTDDENLFNSTLNKYQKDLD